MSQAVLQHIQTAYFYTRQRHCAVSRASFAIVDKVRSSRDGGGRPSIGHRRHSRPPTPEHQPNQPRGRRPLLHLYSKSASAVPTLSTVSATSPTQASAPHHSARLVPLVSSTIDTPSSLDEITSTQPASSPLARSVSTSNNDRHISMAHRQARSSPRSVDLTAHRSSTRPSRSRSQQLHNNAVDLLRQAMMHR